MQRQPLDIRSPLGGQSRELEFQQGDGPYTSPELLNIFPRDVFSRRRRCGSRPPLRKAFAQQLAGTSVDLIAEVREATDTKGVTISESFDSELTDPPWSLATWLAYGGTTTPSLVTSFPSVQNSYGTFPSGAPQNASLSMFLDAPSNGFVSTTEYTITTNVRLFSPAALAGTASYSTWLRMDDTTPNGPLNGVVLILTASFGASSASWSLDLITFASGAIVDADSTVASSGSAQAQLDTTWNLVVRCNADATSNKIIATATPNHTTPVVMTCTKTIGTAAAGERVGWSILRSLQGATVGTPPSVQVNQWDFQHTADSVAPSGVRNRVVAIGGDAIYEENNASQLAAGAVDNAGTDAATGADAITAGNDLTAGRLLQAVDLRGTLYIVNHSSDSNATFLYYSPGGSLKGAVFSSSMPKACELIAVYRDALLLAGRRGNGNEWYLSKRGATPTTDANWTADTSVTSAVLGSTSEAGRIGEPITALMRHSDDYMLFGCQSSVWILRGDPNIGGTIDILDPRHGVISASAHCRGPGSSSFFLALDGLYVIPYGGQQEPIPLSKKLPQELRYINMGQCRVFLAYDVVHEGIIIAVTRTDGGQGSYFFYDMDTQGFFPMRFPTNCEPTFLHYYSADAPGQRAVLFGGRDGYIRQFDDFGQSQNDDGIDFTSRMKLGPLLLAPSGYSDGMIREVIPQTAIGSGDVNMYVQVGNNAEEAFEAVERGGFTAHAGLQLTWTPNLRGNACYVTFEKTGGSAWAHEKTTIVREPFGKLRP